MSSSASSSPDGSRTHSSRPSSSRNPTVRRPKLMRSSATAPSVVISTASRNDLSRDNQTKRAFTMLSRVASDAAGQKEVADDPRPSSTRRKTTTPRTRSPHEEELVQKNINRVEKVPTRGGYYSFPNFEDFLDTRQEGATAMAR